MNNLTEKQKRFCDEYLIDLNATRAYKAVYKNCKKDETASVCSSKLLRNAKVKNYIESQLEQMRSEKIADAEEVLEYLTSVLRGQSTVKVFVGEEKVEKTPDEKERLKAAELLGKRFGLFKENVEVKGNIPIVISGGEELED